MLYVNNENGFRFEKIVESSHEMQLLHTKYWIMLHEHVYYIIYEL